MRNDPGIGIVPFGLGLNQQPRDGDAPFLEGRHDFERGVAEHQRRLVGRAPHALQHALDIGTVDVGDRRDARQRRAQVRFGTGQQ